MTRDKTGGSGVVKSETRLVQLESQPEGGKRTRTFEARYGGWIMNGARSKEINSLDCPSCCVLIGETIISPSNVPRESSETRESKSLKTTTEVFMYFVKWNFSFAGHKVWSACYVVDQQFVVWTRNLEIVVHIVAWAAIILLMKYVYRYRRRAVCKSTRPSCFDYFPPFFYRNSSRSYGQLQSLNIVLL